MSEKCDCSRGCREIILPVQGMMCGNCSARLNKALNALAGVEAEADHEKGEVKVRLCPEGDLEAVKETILDLGFEL